MKNLKSNTLSIGGNISKIDVKPGREQNTMYGTITIAIDDGYYSKTTPQQWVEQTIFADVKVDDRVLKQLKNGCNVGDQISIDGKLAFDTWTDNQSQKSRSALKVRALSITGHISKEEINCLKQNGFIQTRQNQQQGGFAPHQGGQQQSGGFAPQQGGQQQPGGFAPQQGGQQQSGGFAPQQGGQQQSGGFALQQS